MASTYSKNKKSPDITLRGNPATVERQGVNGQTVYL